MISREGYVGEVRSNIPIVAREKITSIDKVFVGAHIYGIDIDETKSGKKPTLRYGDPRIIFLTKLCAPGVVMKKRGKGLWRWLLS